MTSTYTAFLGMERLASGDLASVARAVHAAQDRQADMPLVFEDAGGSIVDLDLRGTADDVVARLPAPAKIQVDAQRPRGRPKLGVTAREITLLPKHWAWLQQQPGGASAALRRLVEQAQAGSADADARRAAQNAAYRVMQALAGHLEGYEEALRALFADEAIRFDLMIEAWPADVRAYVSGLAQPSFTKKD